MTKQMALELFFFFYIHCSRVGVIAGLEEYTTKSIKKKKKEKKELEDLTLL